MFLVTGGSGTTSGYTDSTEIYTESSGAWRIVGALPYVPGGYDLSIIAYDQSVYIFGDRWFNPANGNFEDHDDILKFDATSETWMRVGKMTEAKSFSTASIIDAEIMKHCILF